MPRFADMLTKTADEIKAPPPLPIGLWHLQASGPYEIADLTTKDGKKMEKITFKLRPVSAIEVDEDELAEFGSFTKVSLRRDFLYSNDPDEENSRLMTENAMKKFLIDMGVFEEGMSIGEAMAAYPNGQCQGEIGRRADPNDPERFYTEIKRTFPL